MSDGLLLVDAASQYYRAFYGVPASVVSPDGHPINAVRGFFDGLSKLVEQFATERVVLAWDDDWRPAFRVSAVPSYKAHRLSADGGEETPDELARQVPVIRELAQALGICVVGVPGFEADDVIATLAARRGTRTIVVTGDRDLFQVIDDHRGIAVWYTAGGAPRLIDAAAVQAAHGVGPDRYADLALLRGDPSDGLPGVKGIGAKTAAKLIGEFESVSELLGAAVAGDARIGNAVALSLIEHAEYLVAAMPVVRVVPDVPVGEVDDRLSATPFDQVALQRLIDAYGLARVAERWQKVVAGLGVDPQVRAE